MVAFLTALLIFGTELVAGTGERAADDRLLATIMGAVIAIIAMGIGRWIAARREAESPTDEGQLGGEQATAVPG